MHEVIRTINGRQYRYLEESYRVPGLRTPPKRSTYLGPVEPAYDDVGGHKRQRGMFGAIDELVRKKWDWEHEDETPEQERERIAVEEKERERTSRSNDLLTARSIGLEELAEVAASQKGEARSAESEKAAEGSGTAAGGSSDGASDGSNTDGGEQ
jgi:hypothetical protein